MTTTTEDGARGTEDEVRGTEDGARGSIGALPWPQLLRQARRLADLGWSEVPQAAAELAELAVAGPAEVFALSRRLTEPNGSIVLSSGGTTGPPKITFVAYDQAVGRLLREWRPLGPRSVLLNLFSPGRMWASHYYVQALAERSGCRVVPSGPLEAGELHYWLDAFESLGVNAVAGTPSGLTDLAQAMLDADRTLPVRTVIWMAEPWTEVAEKTVRAAFPQAEFWGNYGSVETYVVATNTSACDLRVLHLMPDQVLELDDAGALLSRVGEGWTLPAVRYRLGDRLAAAQCRCGRPDGLRVLGRADDAFKLHGSLLSIGELVELATSVPGVSAAQLELLREEESWHGVRRMTVHYTGAAEPAELRRALLAGSARLFGIELHHPEALEVVRVPKLTMVERTGKIPPMIWRSR
ncbi:AMP-binding protein [Kitasatospora sp. NBC_01266]|uniref:AMP-binding protein n=1 Tax=Kitasatospora sp. NBC_01266 TaxID=2903572 RepID=UPI002E30C8EE|nr:AMP-binding protein [Kitasatospora sp. NBC_01266]